MNQFRNDPEPGVTNPALYYVIGWAEGMSEAGQRFEASAHHRGYGQIAFFALLSVAPDGLIIQAGDQCFITDRRQLRPFDPARTDWHSSPGSTNAREMTAREWRDYTSLEIKTFLRHFPMEAKHK